MRTRSGLGIVATALLAAACGPSGTQEQAPVAPSNVTAEPGPGYVQVRWQDMSANETGFAVYRRAAGSALTAAQAGGKVGEVGPDVEAYVDGDVAPGASYEYEVVAVGAVGESDRAAAPASVTVPIGVGAMVGLANNRLAPHTALFLLPSVPEQERLGGGSLRVEGPPAWNRGAVFEAPLSAAALEGWHSRLVFTPPVPGDYDVTVTTSGGEYTAVASVPQQPRVYPLPADIEVTEASADAVAATWDGDDAYESYYVAVYEPDLSTRVTDYGGTRASAHELTGLALEAGAYHFFVAAYPVDLLGQPVMVEDYGYAMDVSEVFVISALGTACLSDAPIQDPALAAAFTEAVGGAGSPACGDVAEVEHVDASWRDIADLSGIEFALGLVDLQLDGNLITDLGFVHYLPELRYLYLGGNPVVDLEPLRGLPLRGISLWGTAADPGHAADVVASLAELESIHMGGAGPSDMSFLEGKDLVILDYGHNGVTSLPDLSASTRLHLVNVEGNELSSVADLDALIAAFSGRTPEEWWQGGFEVNIVDNRFELEDPEVTDRIAALEAQGVAVTYVPQREPLEEP